MIIECIDHRSLVPAWQVPESWKRSFCKVGLNDNIGKQPLLFICLWYRYFIQVDIRWEEQIIRSDRRLSIGFHTGFCRVALSCIHNRSGEIIGKCNSLSAI